MLLIIQIFLMSFFPAEGVQEDYLSSYGEYEGSVDDIPTDLLGSIPLVSKDS